MKNIRITTIIIVIYFKIGIEVEDFGRIEKSDCHSLRDRTELS